MKLLQQPLGRKHEGGINAAWLMSLGLISLALAGVAWVYIGMVTRDQWPIRWLELNGSFERVSAEQLRAGLAPLITGSFFTVDIGAVRDVAFKQAWVAEVSVQKRWPDTVSVRITEFEPVAHWIGERLISTQGRAFAAPGAAEIQGLPWLEGPNEKLPEVFDAWRRFSHELLPVGLEIERVRLDRRGAWYLALTNGTEIQIGRGDGLMRLRRLVASWPGLMNGRDLPPLGVDLRYSNGFAVRWPETPARLAGNYGKES